MALLLSLSRLVTLCLTVLGAYALHVFSEQNTLYPQIVSHRSAHTLPTGEGGASTITNTATFPDSFTGIEAIDTFLSTLLVFFWPLVEGTDVPGSLVGFLFAGQAVAGWTATVLEASRTANRGRVVSFATVVGLMVQAMGFALIGPAYFAVYLFTSPLVTSSSSALITPSTLSIDEGMLSGHPFGLIIGFILPTVLMSLPAPAILSTQSKIIAVLVWQFFPLWSTVYTRVWRAALWPAIEYASERDALATQLPLLRNVYRFALALSVPAHIATCTLSIASTLVPSLFTSQAVAALSPWTVFVPPNPFDGSVRAASVGEGSRWFLQNDYLITSLGYLVWALASRYSAGVQKATTGSSAFGIESLVDVTLRCVLLGPMAAALTLLWDRDEAVFAAAEAAEEKKAS